jgi:hypothetical protein
MRKLYRVKKVAQNLGFACNFQTNCSMYTNQCQCRQINVCRKFAQSAHPAYNPFEKVTKWVANFDLKLVVKKKRTFERPNQGCQLFLIAIYPNGVKYTK